VCGRLVPERSRHTSIEAGHDRQIPEATLSEKVAGLLSNVASPGGGQNTPIERSNNAVGEGGCKRQILWVQTFERETEILNAASGIESLRATIEIGEEEIVGNVSAPQLRYRTIDAGLGQAEPLRDLQPMRLGIEGSVSDTQIESVRPERAEGNMSDSQSGVSRIEKGRRAPQLNAASEIENLRATIEIREEEIERNVRTFQLSFSTDQIEWSMRPSQLSFCGDQVSEDEQFESTSQLSRKSVVVKSFSEGESLLKVQMRGPRPECVQEDQRLCQSDFSMKAKGAGLGRTMPLRTLSISKTSDVTKIWEEAERRLGASRANFSLVSSGSCYLPPDGFLDSPEQLFEIRWRGRAGDPGRPVEVTRGDRMWLEPCDRETSLQDFLTRLGIPERRDRLIWIGNFVHEGELKGMDAEDPVLDYFAMDVKPAIKIEFLAGDPADEEEPPDWWVNETTSPNSDDADVPEEDCVWNGEEEEKPELLPIWVNFNGSGYWAESDASDIPASANILFKSTFRVVSLPVFIISSNNLCFISARIHSF
jgi:hypothetical protein